MFPQIIQCSKNFSTHIDNSVHAQDQILSQPEKLRGTCFERGEGQREHACQWGDGSLVQMLEKQWMCQQKKEMVTRRKYQEKVKLNAKIKKYQSHPRLKCQQKRGMLRFVVQAQMYATLLRMVCNTNWQASSNQYFGSLYSWKRLLESHM